MSGLQKWDCVIGAEEISLHREENIALIVWIRFQDSEGLKNGRNNFASKSSGLL